MKIYKLVLLISVINLCGPYKVEASLNGSTLDSVVESSLLYDCKLEVLKKDTLLRKVKIPRYVINPCAKKLLKVVILNCLSTPAKGRVRMIGYSFYSEKRDSFFYIMVEPEYSVRDRKNLFGIFQIDNQNFYCYGAKPQILSNLPLDTIEIESDIFITNTKHKTYIDLSTIELEKYFIQDNKIFYFFIKPCRNFNRKTTRNKLFKCPDSK